MKKILIVDDEQDIVESLKFVLEVSGFVCYTAFNGEDGIRLAIREKMATLGETIILTCSAAIGEINTDLMKIHTHQYAKRQRTWFKHQLPVHFVNNDEKALENVLNMFKNNNYSCDVLTSAGLAKFYNTENYFYEELYGNPNSNFGYMKVNDSIYQFSVHNKEVILDTSKETSLEQSFKSNLIIHSTILE